MTIVARSRWCSTASRISSAVCTGTKTAPSGGAGAVGPESNVTCAPRPRAAPASPEPILRPGREQERRQEVVGDPVGGLREEVRGRRCHDDSVAPLRERDVLDGIGALRVEEVGEHRSPGQGAERQRADELTRVLGETHRDRGAEPAELAQQVHCLVGGDRPGDAEDQLAAFEAHALGVSSSLTRYSTLAAAISSSAPLVGFLCRLSTRGGAPRLSCRDRFAARTTSKYRFETLFNALSSEGNAINCVPPDRAG